jgi:hypothetical protein
VAIEQIIAAAVDWGRRLGRFDTVNPTEPTHVLGKGVHLAVWPNIGDGVQSSGLGALSMRIELMFRVYGPAHLDPVDAIDLELIGAVDALGAALCADFTLGGLVRQVDAQGAHGQPLGFTTGWMDIQEGTCRVMTLRCPVIANDVWTYGG